MQTDGEAGVAAGFPVVIPTPDEGMVPMHRGRDPLRNGLTRRVVTANPIMDPNTVRGIVHQFRAKYGAAIIQRYYAKCDVTVDLSKETHDDCDKSP